MLNNLAIIILSGFLIIVGTIGSILPFLPGLPVSWLGLLIYSWYTGFSTGLIWGLVIFGLLIGVTMLVDVFAPALAAKGRKASNYGVAGAFLGGLFGIFTMGPLGIIIGPFVGAYLGELTNNASNEKALNVAWASLIGLVVGSIFKLILGLSMFIYFVWMTLI